MRKKLMTAAGFLLAVLVVAAVVGLTVIDIGWQAAAVTWGAALVLVALGALATWLIDKGLDR